MSSCAPRPCKTLSEVGVEAEETLRLTEGLPTRRAILEAIGAFIERARRSRTTQLLWLVGEWGEGKTAVYRGVLRKRSDVCTLYLATSRVLDHMEKALDSSLWSPYIFLAALLRALAEAYEELRHVAQPLEQGVDEKTLAASLVALRSAAPKVCRGGSSTVLVFLDEFEDIVARLSTERGLRLLSSILEAFVELINGNVKPVAEAGSEGWLHLVVATTSSAERVLETRLEVSDIWGRLKRRFVRVVLRRMLVAEVLHHLSRLIDYVYCGENLGFAAVADPPTLLNFVSLASVGLPAATERIVNNLSTLLAARGRSGCGGSSEKLTLGNALEVLGSLRTVVEGEEERVLMEDSYVVEERRCVDIIEGYLGRKGYSRRLCRLILLSRGGLGLDVLEGVVGGREELAKVLTVLEASGVIHRGRALIISTGIERFIAEAEELIAEALEKSPEVAAQLGSEELLELYRSLVDPLLYIHSSGAIALFVPSDPSLLKAMYAEVVGLDDVVASLTAHMVLGILEQLAKRGAATDGGECIVVDPGIQNRVFFSQEVAALDFIARKDVRIRLWRRARSERSPEPFLWGVLVPIADALRSFFSGGGRSDIVRVRITGLGEGMPIAQLEIVAAKDGAPARFYIKELEASYVPTLRVDVLPLTGPSGRRILEEYVRRLRLSSLFDRPHAAILVSAGGLGEFDEHLRVLRELGVGVVVLRFKTIDHVRLSALGILGQEQWGDPQQFVDAALRALRGEAIPGVNTFAYQSYIASRLGREYGLDELAARIEEVLRETGALLPQPRRTVEVGGRELGTSSIQEAARSLRWLVHYPQPIRGIALEDLMRYVTENIRRYLAFYQKYRDVVGPDIESPEELGNKLAPLADLGVLKLEDSGGSIAVTLTLGNAPFFKRLVAAGDELPLDRFLSLFVVKGGSPDLVIATVVEVLRAIGVADVQGGKLRLYLTPSSIRGRLEDVKRVLRQYEERYGELQVRLGYVVSGKVRHSPPWNPGYRYSYTPELLKLVKSALSRVENSLDALPSLETAVELCRTLASAERLVSDVLYHLAKREAESIRYHSYVIERGYREFKAVQRLLRDIEQKLLTASQRLASLLNRYVFHEEVRIEAPLAKAVRMLEKEVERLMNEVYPFEAFARSVEKLWEENPGRRFPFTKDNPFYNSYKVYKLVRLLEWHRNIVSVDLSREVPHRYSGSEELRGILREAEEIGREISRSVEQLSDAGRLYAALRERLKSLEPLRAALGRDVGSALPPTIAQVSKIRPPASSYTLDPRGLAELRKEIERWRSGSGFREDPRSVLKRLESLANEVDRLYREARRNLEAARRVRRALSRVALRTGANPASVVEGVELLEKRVEELIGKAVRCVEAPERLLLEDVERVLRELLNKLREAHRMSENLLRTAIDSARGFVSRLAGSVEEAALGISRIVRFVEKLAPAIPAAGAVVKSLTEALSRASELQRLRSLVEASGPDEVPAIVEDAVKIFGSLPSLDPEEVVEKVMGLLRSGGLEKGEGVVVEVLLRSVARGSEKLRLSRVVEEVSKRIGREEALRAVYSLIERGVMDAELVL